MDKLRLPTVNQVTILGVIKQVEFKPSNLFSWLFYVEVPSTYRNNEAMLICGTNGNSFREIFQKVVQGRDWALINGKIRTGGFIQVREISIIPEPQFVSSGIHHVGLVGKILSIKHLPGRVYEWQFDVDIFPEYGATEKQEVEATLTCGVGGGSITYSTELQEAHEGQWVTVQGKIRNNGFIQVRSMVVFDVQVDTF